MNGHLALTKLLVDEGASPALANDKNYVPLDLASLNDKIDVVDYFLSKAGGMESQNEDGLSGATEEVDLDDAEDGGEASGS